MAMSNYLEQVVLNAIFRGVDYTSPDKIYLALYTTDPTDADNGTEVNGGAYVRMEVVFSEPEPYGEEYIIRNTADIDFPIATAPQGMITHVGLRDAAVGGNLLYHGPLTKSKEIQDGDQFRILEGNLGVTIS